MSSKLIDFEDFETIKKTLDINSIKATFPDMTKSNLSRFDIIKITLAILFTLADLNNDYDDQASLGLFKQAAMLIILSVIKPLVKDLLQAQIDAENKLSIDFEIIELKACNLAKWWSNYFCVLDIVSKAKEDHIKYKEWNGSANEWYGNEEFVILQESLKALDSHLHWKILILQAICRRENLLSGKIESKTNEEYFQIINDYYANIINVEYSDALVKEKGAFLKV